MCFLLCSVMLVLVLVTASEHTKRRLCVEYAAKDYRWIGPSLANLYVSDQIHCMKQCALNQNCWAFNYGHQQGLCELMRRRRDCMSIMEQPDFHFVHWISCDMVAPWRKLNPKDISWQWVDPSSSLNMSTLVSLSNTNSRYVSRVLYRGMFLPGWWQLGKFRTAAPFGERVICENQYGQWLSFDSHRYMWLPLTAGQSIPTKAVIAGYWPDESPLYIIRDEKSTGEYYSGYYNERNSKSFVRKQQQLWHPLNMEIMVYL